MSLLGLHPGSLAARLAASKALHHASNSPPISLEICLVWSFYYNAMTQKPSAITCLFQDLSSNLLLNSSVVHSLFLRSLSWIFAFQLLSWNWLAMKRKHRYFRFFIPLISLLIPPPLLIPHHLTHQSLLSLIPNLLYLHRFLSHCLFLAHRSICEMTRDSISGSSIFRLESAVSCFSNHVKPPDLVISMSETASFVAWATTD